MQKIKAILVSTCLVSILVNSGCGITQSVARHFVNTQPEVTVKQKDYDEPLKIVGGHAQVYVPPKYPEDQNNNLLVRYTPIIVQGIEPDDKIEYPADSDLLGQPELASTENNGYSISINTEKPVVYASVNKVKAQGADLKQLIYVFWYPRHPVGMVEKGDIDGGVLRITLDAANRPSIYEYVMACGCWHGVFVSEHIEAWAQEALNTKDKGKKYFVERAAEGDDDWKVRDIIMDAANSGRPVIFLSAGKHQCVAIQPETYVMGLHVSTGKPYALLDSAKLEQLPVVGSNPAKTASMFNPEGLVWGAQRKGEEKMFNKLDHGGWPRRLDAMKIHWDEESWNDDTLLDKFLRVPAKIAAADSVAVALKH